MLPMAKPGIISIGIFNVLGQWNQYLLPLVLNQGDTEELGAHPGTRSTSPSAGLPVRLGALFAGLTIAMLPVLVMYVLFQRQVQAGLTAGTLK